MICVTEVGMFRGLTIRFNQDSEGRDYKMIMDLSQWIHNHTSHKILSILQVFTDLKMLTFFSLLQYETVFYYVFVLTFLFIYSNEAAVKKKYKHKYSK